jgi:UDP-glucose 4-epimerase
VIAASRRPGDPACVTACADKIQQVLGWQPKYNNLDAIIYTTLAWEIARDNLRSIGVIEKLLSINNNKEKLVRSQMMEMALRLAQS